jgi:hypothetical protein
MILSVKRISCYLVIIILSALLISACKKNSITNPPVPQDTGYFPNGDGSRYIYSVVKTESGDTLSVGTRSTEYSGTSVKNGNTYQVQIDSINIVGASDISLSYFRKTNDTLYYFLDTTGLSAVIPDSLKNYVYLDREMKILFFPVTENKSWSVFRVSAVYLIFNIPLLTVECSYDGTEAVTLNLNSGDVTENAVKLKYTMTLSIPNTLSKSTFTAYSWLVEGIGIVKWQGSATILSAFTGGGVNLSDTTSVITQSLISYDVKQ